ncbi:MAG: protoglobin family protein [Planctomycetales bacterium]|nr:protoglobin family protein [Planctomycetales bacterium]
MHKVDEERLETDAKYRFDYLAEFIGFTSEDAATIQAFAPHLGPRIPELVDQTYEYLLSYDATARHFVPHQFGFDGPAPESLESLDVNHPQVKFRKDHLNRYFMQLIGRSYDDRMVQYLDMVGKIHTTKAGSQEIEIPLVQMNALMGLVSDLLNDFILKSPLDEHATARTLRAFSKLLWIQTDFISRHYATTSASVGAL